MAWASPWVGWATGYPLRRKAYCFFFFFFFFFLGVSLSLSAPDAVCRGPGQWSFPLPLLHDENFCMALTLEMRVFLDAHEIGPDMTHAQRWDDLKACVRDYTQAQSFTVGRQRRAKSVYWLVQRVYWLQAQWLMLR